MVMYGASKRSPSPFPPALSVFQSLPYEIWSIIARRQILSHEMVNWKPEPTVPMCSVSVKRVQSMLTIFSPDTLRWHSILVFCQHPGILKQKICIFYISCHHCSPYMTLSSLPTDGEHREPDAIILQRQHLDEHRRHQGLHHHIHHHHHHSHSHSHIIRDASTRTSSAVRHPDSATKLSHLTNSALKSRLHHHDLGISVIPVSYQDSYKPISNTPVATVTENAPVSTLLDSVGSANDQIVSIDFSSPTQSFSETGNLPKQTYAVSVTSTPQYVLTIDTLHNSWIKYS